MMQHTLNQNAHAVLLPAFSSLQLSDAVKRFLTNGGCSILLGETRAEYVAREMTQKRKAEETLETFLELNKEAASLSGNLLVAVDQEISAICRLHDLVPPFPTKEELQNINVDEFETISSNIALAARKLGINCFLGPILDIVTGNNPWLHGRTWATDPQKIAKISSAYIRGIQSVGIAAAAKHFPGYPDLSLDPAIDAKAQMTDSIESIEMGLIPFEDAIKNKVEIMMTGPAIVKELDPEKPASLSPKIIHLLRGKLNFSGVVMSDDLDSKATLRGRPITEVAVDALNAGSDLLLIADIRDQIEKIVSSIIKAVNCGKLSNKRLDEAAKQVRLIAKKYA